MVTAVMRYALSPATSASRKPTTAMVAAAFLTTCCGSTRRIRPPLLPFTPFCDRAHARNRGVRCAPAQAATTTGGGRSAAGP